MEKNLKERIKLIMCDIDGTLLTSNHEVTEATKTAIAKVREQGVLFGIATGRALEAVTLLTPEWNVDHLIDVYMGYNGAHVLDYTLNVDERTHLLEGKYIKEIIPHFQDLEVTFCVYVGRTLYTSEHNHWSNRLATNNKFTEKTMDESIFENPQTKLVIACDPEYMDVVIERAKTFSSPNYRCFRSAPMLFEYVNPELSKSFGIEKICALHGFTIDNVLAFGDANNDYEMIRDCGVGVCMENGAAETKSVADFITTSNDDEGISRFLNEYLL